MKSSILAETLESGFARVSSTEVVDLTRELSFGPGDVRFHIDNEAALKLSRNQTRHVPRAFRPRGQSFLEVIILLSWGERAYCESRVFERASTIVSQFTCGG